MSADAGAVLIRLKHVVGTDCDQAGVTDFHLVMKLDQTLGLAPILRAESSPAKHEDHGIWALKIRKFATFARVIGQLIIGKYCASYDVRSHVVRPPLSQSDASAFYRPLAQAANFSPNMGRPLLDDSRVASSWITSQCSTRIPLSMRRISAAIQLTGWPKSENRPCTITKSPSATIVPGSYFNVGGRLLIRLKRPSRPGAI